MCDCKDTPKIGTSLEIASAGVSDRIGARLTNDAARALMRYCSANRCNQSEALRRALVQLGKASGDPQAKLDAVAQALGLDPAKTLPADLLKAIQDLIDSAAPSEDPTGGAAQAAPVTTLSKSELAGIKRKGLTAEQYLAKKNAATRRV